MAMGFNGLVSSHLNRAAKRSRSDAALDDRLLAERTRIAQELHDTLLQGFFAASMQLSAAVDDLPANLATKPRFGDILQLMDRVIEQGRCAVQGLRAPNDRIGS